MYAEHFDLQGRPFSLTPDPDAIVWTNSFSAAFETAVAEILDDAALTLVSGDAGSGKTTLALAVLNDARIAKICRVVSITNRVSSAAELFDFILTGLEDVAEPKGHRVDRVVSALQALRADGLVPLVLLDEAQSMNAEAARAVTRFVEATRDTDAQPVIVMIGETQLGGLLNSKEGTDLRASIGRRINLPALIEAETAAYVAGRLTAAGHGEGALFDAGALHEIHVRARGVPRQINRLCEQVLTYGAEFGRVPLDSDMVSRALGQRTPAWEDDEPDEFLLKAPQAQGSGNVVALQTRSGRKANEEFPAPVSRLAELSRRHDEPPISPFLDPVPQVADDGPDTESARPLPAQDNPASLPDPAPKSTGSRRAALIAVALVAVVFPTSVARIQSTASAVVASAPAEALAATQAELDGILRALTDAEIRKSVIEAEVATSKAELEASVSQLSELRAENSAERASLERLRATIIEEQSRLEDLARRTAATEQDLQAGSEMLDAIKAEIAAAEAGKQMAARALPDAGTAALGPDIGAVNDTVMTLQPLVAGPGAEEFFAAALAGADPGDIAQNYARAAIRGHGRAARYLGQLFETGDGVAFSPAIAQRWYDAAANPDRMHDLGAPSPLPSGTIDRVEAVTALRSDDGTADFIWDGTSPQFGLQIADADRQLIAVARTPLTALRATLPGAAAFWRVQTVNGGATTHWLAID